MLNPRPVASRPDLVPPAVLEAAQRWIPEALVFEIDPDHADTDTLCRVYDLPAEAMGNAVLVLGRRGGEERRACCMTLAHRRVDVNNVVRHRLDARKASFAPMDLAVSESGMEYGGITPVGLPSTWPVWVDAAVAATPELCIGSGIRGSKLVVPGAALLNLPGAELVPDLARDVS